MKKAICSLLVLIVVVSAEAQQDFDQLLQQILQNNSSLKADQAAASAQKVENRVGNTLANPQMEGAYLWGSPTAIGDRKDFSVSQEFDFPTVYYHRKKMADLMDQQAEMSSAQFRLEVLMEAAQLWVELVSLNQKIAVQTERTQLLEQLEQALAEQLAAGETDRIDLNKARLNRIQAEGSLASLKKEKAILEIGLSTLNGNQPVAINELVYLPVDLPADMEAWVKQVCELNPQVQLHRLDVGIAGRQTKIEGGKRLPKISGGFMSEWILDEKLQGVSWGLSVPLWESKNTVKAARLREESARQEADAFRLAYENELRKLYRSVELASAQVAAFNKALEGIHQEALLKDAFASGQISLIHYLQELQFDYDAVDQLQEAEKELQLQWVKMKVLTGNYE